MRRRADTTERLKNTVKRHEIKFRRWNRRRILPVCSGKDERNNIIRDDGWSFPEARRHRRTELIKYSASLASTIKPRRRIIITQRYCCRRHYYIILCYMPVCIQ